MQPSSSTPAPAAASSPSSGSAPQVVAHLRDSRVFRDYRAAFEATTGLPLALRSTGSFQPPLQDSRQVNPFCALMAGANKTCAACLRMQERVETEAATEAKTLRCFAGLSESAIPVRVGEQTIGFLQTGQVLFEAPTARSFAPVARQLREWNPDADLPKLKAAYLRTRVLAPRQYASAVNLVAIFAQHLASLSNQVMVQSATAESPVIARARAYIAERLGEQITLRQVAAAVHVSTFYFCKLFRQATSLTFTDYLARLRVEAVKQSLLNPHLRVSEAAFAAGFQSLSQFNRVFRRIAGEAPKHYRDRIHGPAPARLAA